MGEMDPASALRAPPQYLTVAGKRATPSSTALSFHDAVSVIDDDVSGEEDDEVFLELPVSDSSRSTMAQPPIEARSSRMVNPAANRRRSSLFEIGFRPSVCASSITSFACAPRIDEIRQPVVQHENSYHMEPPVKFKADPVKKIIHDVLQNALQDKTYDPISCALTTKALSADIKAQVKELDFKRYKIVCMVMIGEKKEQDVRIGSRCVWDTHWDSYASANFENPHIYAVGTVYAMYYE